MGVPALFRWISTKYPKIISPVVEQDTDAYGNPALYLDPNPNGEIDNLYLDMNGIVHPCTHPTDKPAPATEDEMFLDVFKYTDRVVKMARPRKVLVIAVDGVAPRAKMNQQRQRRFRAAKEAEVAEQARQEELRAAQARGQAIEDAVKNTKKWDTNVITPGTPFMDGLAAALRYWVAYKFALDPGWRDLQVIISDATVPGEGEHKLMSFIRSQRLDPTYDPKTRHCIYGLDADLIFLALATHVTHFRVLREDVFADGGLKYRKNAVMNEEERAAHEERALRKPFLWLNINVLRDYLALELAMNVRFWDLERAIDDWVFICFFVGNDFLPHMPAISIRDRGIETLLGCWRKTMYRRGDFITCDGHLDPKGVLQLLANVAQRESEILQRKWESDQLYHAWRSKQQQPQQQPHVDQRMQRQFRGTLSKAKEKAPLTPDKNMTLMDTSGNLVEGYAQLSNSEIVQTSDAVAKANAANVDAAASLRRLLAAKSGDVDTPSETASDAPSDILTDTSSSQKPAADTDVVRLHEPGYRERYYMSKFNLTTLAQVDAKRREVIHAYLEGISWVLLYYYQGCASWQWFYPFHYAPFAADFHDMLDVVQNKPITFLLGQPFRPFEQLMSVLPAASGHTLPVVLRELMTDPDSEIVDFYPQDFAVDMNGAKASWQGIALLPFIEQDRLLSVVQTRYPLLTEAERQRNTNRTAQLYISSSNKNYAKFLAAAQTDSEVAFSALHTGLAGTIRPLDGFTEHGVLRCSLDKGDMPDVSHTAYLPVWYDFPRSFPGKSMLLHGYIAHEQVLTKQDEEEMGQRRPNGHFENNVVYVNDGPRGRLSRLMYSARYGGYRAFIENPKIRRALFKPGHNVRNAKGADYGKRPGDNPDGLNKRGSYGQQRGQQNRLLYRTTHPSNVNNNQAFRQNNSFGGPGRYQLNHRDANFQGQGSIYRGSNQGYQGSNQGWNGHHLGYGGQLGYTGYSSRNRSSNQHGANPYR